MTTRTRIAELISRHELEPSLRDVVVEGAFDQRVVQKFVKSLDGPKIAVLQIANIEIPDEIQLAQEHGSNRGKILALARELTSKAFRHTSIYSIVDRDYDDLGVSQVSVAGVRRTDYSTMDMYFFDPELLQSVAEDFLNVTLDDYQALLNNVLDVLGKISLLYAANASLGLNCRILPLRKCCSYNSSAGLAFDLDEYLGRYFNTALTACTRAQFESEVMALGSNSPADARGWVRGKNYWELLQFVLRACGANRQHCTAESLQNAFILALDQSRFAEWTLFGDLAVWASDD